MFVIKKINKLLTIPNNNSKLLFIRNEQIKLADYFSAINLSYDFLTYQQLFLKPEEQLADYDVLVLSFGKITVNKFECLLVLGKQANKSGIPLLFSLDGLSDSSVNLQAFDKLSNQLTYTVMIGNYQDVMASAGYKGKPGEPHDMELIKKIARVYQSVVVIKTEKITITDGENCFIINAMQAQLAIYDITLIEALISRYLGETNEQKIIKKVILACQHYQRILGAIGMGPKTQQILEIINTVNLTEAISGTDT